MLGGQPRQPGQGGDGAAAQQLEGLADLQLLDVLGQVAAGHALVDVLVPGQRRELLDPRLHVVAGHPLARGDRVEVDLVDDVAVGLDDPVGYVDAEVALRLEDGDPEAALEHDLVLRRPDRGEVVAGVPGREDVGDRHVRKSPMARRVAVGCGGAGGRVSAGRSAADQPSVTGSTSRNQPSLTDRGGDVVAPLGAGEGDRGDALVGLGAGVGDVDVPTAVTASTRPPAVTSRPEASRAVPAWMTSTSGSLVQGLGADDDVAARRRLGVALRGHHHGDGRARLPDRRRHVGQRPGRRADQQRRERRVEQGQQRLGLGVAEAGVELHDAHAARR